MDINIGGMIGLYGGMICGIFGWWFGRKQARKKRGLDELYDYIWQKARSYSWYVTLGMIYVFFSLIMFGIDLSPAMVLGILLLTHLGSWAFTGVILAASMSASEPMQISQKKIGLSVIAVSVVAFTVCSVITDNWLFLLFSIPPNLIGILMAFTVNKKESGLGD